MSGVGQSILLDAHRELRRAAEAFRREGDTTRSIRCEQLAVDVDAQGKHVQAQVMALLPGPSSRRIRPDAIAEELGWSGTLVYVVLEELRDQRLATQSGGWWRRRA